jgi:hypothetical protein
MALAVLDGLPLMTVLEDIGMQNVRADILQ